jgi:hypothetical protein
MASGEDNDGYYAGSSAGSDWDLPKDILLISYPIAFVIGMCGGISNSRGLIFFAFAVALLMTAVSGFIAFIIAVLKTYHAIADAIKKTIRSSRRRRKHIGSH